MEQRLPGGNLGGAVRVGDTVRRAAGPWTPAVAALLRHLENVGFERAPRFLGVDERGREILSFIDGETVGDAKPWPAWIHADETLDQVADWLREFHEAAASFVPPDDARWRFGGSWTEDSIVGHNDAAPYNAVWRDGQLVAFIDWELAAPVTREWDLAFVAFSWVPLHARTVVEAEGFTNLQARSARLWRLLDRYGFQGDAAAFVEVVRARARSMADGLRSLAAAGDHDAIRLVAEGHADNADRAADELADFVVSGAWESVEESRRSDSNR
jgi:aminoglycoside phosphotransferase (APT) family kinase protein